MDQILFLFIFNSLLAAGIIRFAISLALIRGIADRPGGHKQHAIITPFVGGIGILAVLLVALIMLTGMLPGQSLKWLSLGAGSIIIFATGFVDDLLQLNYKVRLIAQILAALIIIIGGGIVINNLGYLIPGSMLGLGLFAIPFTVFAIVGVINSLNMIDGVDGLSGTISLISFLLICTIALIVNDSANLTLAASLAGGTAGFLYFNLRYASQRCAKTFLGDNGSMLLGLIFAWIFIDLSQGPNPTITPVTAIWLFAIPVMDTLSVMLRRIWLGKSPFSADRHHLHHLLLRAGFVPEEIVFIIGTLHLLLGMMGLVGWYLEISEFIMLISYLITFMAYFLLTLRPWRFVPLLTQLHHQIHTKIKHTPPPNASK